MVMVVTSENYSECRRYIARMNFPYHLAMCISHGKFFQAVGVEMFIHPSNLFSCQDVVYRHKKVALAITGI